MSPRFGHTLTLVNKPNDPGKAVLFGGATGLEGSFSINSDTFIWYLESHKWVQIAPSGTIPCPRAAHAACCWNGNELIIYGGATGSSGLASDELFLWELRKGDQNAEWIKIPITKGPTPGRRYGHTIVFCKPNIIWFGGNMNNSVVNDIWIFNSESSSLQWTKLLIENNIPCPRVYHSAAVCTSGSANGMMVIFGGRNKEGQILNDMWGWRRHRTGEWDWMNAPFFGIPNDRMQHSSWFCGQFFINIGGRSKTNGDDLPIEVYDTENSKWFSFIQFKRFRHAVFFYDSFIYIQGGWNDDNQRNPAKDLNQINWFDWFKSNPSMHEKLTSFLMKKSGNEGNNLGTITKNNENDNKESYSGDKCKYEIKFNDRAVVGKVNRNANDSVRTFSIDKLNENNEKDDLMKLFKTKALFYEAHDKVIAALLRPKEWINKVVSDDDKFIFDIDIILDWIATCTLICKEQPMVLKVEAPVKVFGDIHGQYQDLMRFFDVYNAPSIGPNGDIEGFDYIFLGDYVDRGTHSLETICWLMALKIKYPNQIHMLRGNHEDRWINSAFGFQEEIIIRWGEDESNPLVFTKFNDFFDYLPWAAVVNDTVLCLHGGIGSNLSTISDIEKIPRPWEVIHEVTNIDQQLVVDILWSDPTDSDQENGIQPNSTRDPTGVGNIVKFGPDRVQEFLTNNNLTLILRAHECVMDGFERFAGGKLITVFTATDYCGRHKNAGAIWMLNKQFSIKPYWIYPQECPNKNWNNDEEALKIRPPTPPRKRENSPNDIVRKGSFN